MAIEEHDREDLLRDGRTMPLRGECAIDGATVVVGFRPQGQLSVYCGADPVYQFNTAKELRRAFVDGRRFAAENGSLVELSRASRGGKVEFVSNRIDADTQAVILSSVSGWLQRVRDAVGSDRARWRVVEEDAGRLLDRLRDWLDQLPDDIRVATAPNA